MIEVGRDLWRSSGPIPLLKQEHLETVAQDHVQAGFEHLQGEISILYFPLYFWQLWEIKHFPAATFSLLCLPEWNKGFKTQKISFPEVD